ncbi:class I SAM-dependent methyltransferase [Legionella longbeachae]|uniref:S-adenosyl-L-methionine-dependent methyltransferase n=1 Tax=Legionella longbeachae serogroup 1 (strain NSW150) TaxID=661367 RepID=D3HR24_LEGLN|nr:class I SAM-dependent methyltransferase [Legionella longbeachae]VEE01861.1 O-Methyltransferase involved in polyketide biosynthesis [Legionella oakridgensis]ARB91821.1 SAM-dependent methyltransferase [Legionella longbeachae]ARM35034.1 class I SAM-dependent methyltransferase [Legionella longbeachae]EEZ95545.1 putative methyltransferase [Legionella longbeachae D-4968]QEY50979.1 class I SAM-dependent methyltransferase [Legionella longbeachae]
MREKILKDHNVATTSLLANYWKNEAKSKENWLSLTQMQGTRENDLFKDPLMQNFVNEQVKEEAEQRLDKRMWLPLATRTRFFRQTVSDAVKNKEVKQVIILGSGFDTLPARKIKYTQQFGVRFFEIDQPQILKCKEQIYAEQCIHKNATYIPLDYVNGDLIAALTNNDIDFTKPTLILWEGNTFYLEKEDVLRILRDLSSKFSHMVITFDYMHTLMQTSTQQLDSSAKEKCLEKTLDEFASKKSPFKAFFEPGEIVSLCTKLGIQCVDHKTAAQLAKEYEVDQEPYYTAETYSMVTFEHK